MTKTILASALLLAAAAPVSAKDKLIPLSEADGATLAGKTIALTLHERPSFVAMTAGKATFGLLGSGAMIAAGNKLVDENKVPDPAEIVRSNLSVALRDHYGAQLLPVDTTPTKAKKPKDIAATHADADYVLDVRSAGWSYAYYPTKWGSYWVGYSVQVQLVDTKTGKQVSNAACGANTRENANSPSQEQLHADGARLLKDVTASLGWTCVQLLAKEQFRLPAEKVAATPAAYVDPLAALAPASTVPEQAPTASEATTDTSTEAAGGAGGN